MIHYNFIEIGTYWCDALVESATSETVGLSIEPMQEYLDRLVSAPKVKKVCAAVVAERTMEKTGDKMTIFYIDIVDITKRKLPSWLAQCNSVGNPHPMHIQYEHLGIVKSRVVPVLTWRKLVIMHDIHRTSLLKIDAEGHDCGILNDFLDQTHPKRLPQDIIYETNEPSRAEEYTAMAKRLTDLNYFLHQEGNNTIAIRQTQ